MGVDVEVVGCVVYVALLPKGKRGDFQFRSRIHRNVVVSVTIHRYMHEDMGEVV